jgi:hypothetical protein
MKKFILTAGILMSISSFVVAQQSPAVQKAIKDQNRKANEAKADRIVIDSVKRQVTPPAQQKTGKKKSCCKKKASSCSNDKKKSS